MVRPSTTVKAVLTVLVVVGATIAYFLRPLWTVRILEEAPDNYELVFWIGLVLSVVLFIWRVVPRWLIALAWTILAVYLVVGIRWPPTAPAPEVYLVFILFALFLVLLAKWISDVRRVRRVERRLDERTLADLKRLEGSIAETPGAVPTKFARGATTQALLRLDPATVQAMGDVANLGHQIRNEREMGFPMNLDRILDNIDQLERSMVVRGLTRSRLSNWLTAAQVLVGAVAAFIATTLTG